jgi:hypothetical protein
MTPEVKTVPYDEIIRSMIQFENQLINNRMNWMAAFQGLLFASLGFAWGKNDTKSLITIFCILGIAIALTSLAGLIGATTAMDQLRELWLENKPADYQGPDVMGLPPIVKSKILHYLTPWNAFPLILTCGWGAILWISHRHT